MDEVILMNSVHPGADKIYYDMRDFMVAWISSNPEIPEWKWEKIMMALSQKLPIVSSVAGGMLRFGGGIGWGGGPCEWFDPVHTYGKLSRSIGYKTRHGLRALPTSDDACWTGGLSAEVTPGAKLCSRHVSCVEPQEMCQLSQMSSTLDGGSWMMKILAICDELLSRRAGCEEAKATMNPIVKFVGNSRQGV
ncbi:hypothetical protein Tco_1403327 [Tanacetum coccineum]